MLSTLFVNTILVLSPEDGDQSDGSEVSIRDVKKEKALAIEKIARKKAGLPELELPVYLRTCLSKRSQKLQDGIDKFDSAEKLSGLQEQTLAESSGFLLCEMTLSPCSLFNSCSPLRSQALAG